LLVARRGDTISRETILTEVWGYDVAPDTRTVDNHVAQLRQKIEDDSRQPKHILTAHGKGYKFAP
jgi:two-component system alkaline phosphatase synthesis response regulator PhoP